LVSGDLVPFGSLGTGDELRPMQCLPIWLTQGLFSLDKKW